MKKIILSIIMIGSCLRLTAQENKIESTGNIGIGITNPKGNLQISGTSEASSSTTLNGHLILSSSTTGLVNSFGIHTVAGANPYSWIQSGHKINNNTFDLALNPRGGSVGIGITDPKGNLQINGTSEASSSTTLNGQLILSSSTTGLVNTFGIHTDAEANAYSWIQSGHKINSNTFDLVLNPRGGGIGIGTTKTNGWKLAVNGKIRAKEIKVETGWSDFVFFDDYQLPTLREVENHIQENGHLKDIPSAKEVEKNGIFLGEMDSKLLQKIEELTLYTIQQEKKIQKLEKENEEMKLLSKKLFELQSRLEKLESEK